MNKFKSTVQSIANYNRKLMNWNPIPPTIMLILFVIVGILCYCKTHHIF